MILYCLIVIKDPQTIENNPEKIKIKLNSAWKITKKVDIQRTINVKRGNFGKIDKIIVEAIGAPSYTSSIQKWKGPIPILNKKLIKIIKTEKKIKKFNKK